MSDSYSPDHYTQGYIETIYAIAQTLGPEGFKAFCIGNWMKYKTRAGHKENNEKDLEKAKVYLNWATNGLPDPIDYMLPPQENNTYDKYVSVDVGTTVPRFLAARLSTLARHFYKHNLPLEYSIRLARNGDRLEATAYYNCDPVVEIHFYGVAGGMNAELARVANRLASVCKKHNDRRKA